VFRLLSNLLLPLLALLAAPFWLWKTHKRGGLSSRLLEKLARYDADSPPATGRNRRPIYVHAVSVGEGNIARKLITLWSEKHPEERFLLAMGTSTGFDLARKSPPPRTEVMYAPLDAPPFLNEFFRTYQPSLIVLIEHEVWPNLMHVAAKHGVPVTLANARLSQRSGRRLRKLRPLLGKMYRQLTWVGVQTNGDQERLMAIGIREEALHTVGSVKFDPVLKTPSSSDFEPAQLLESLGQGIVLMALSTHPGEELLFAKAAAQVEGSRIIIIPRHMERRDEITRELIAAGFQVTLRSTGETFGEPSSTKLLVVDSTGEMPAFTRHAQLAFIGKTLTARGGQNPCEAIAAGVAVVAGPAMDNFEPLTTELQSNGGIKIVANEAELATTLAKLAKDATTRKELSQRALQTLDAHRGATERTVEALAKVRNQE
jgi:3-deoxy-D-manno-octulosonic-acid transferase